MSIEAPSRRAMGSHHSSNAGTTTWLTPPHILEALGEFDLDPCAAPEWPTATTHYTLPTDGLENPWFGRVWLNPPYGNEAWTWLDRLADHGRGTALIFARTETAGFVEQVWGKATALLFLHGRLHFHYPDGTRARANSGAPSVLVAYGEQDAYMLRKSGLKGTYLRLKPELSPSNALLDFAESIDLDAIADEWSNDGQDDNRHHAAANAASTVKNAAYDHARKLQQEPR